jgi:ADP-heptose:LPS heptosyltransferase
MIISTPIKSGARTSGQPLLIFITYTGIGDLLMALPLLGRLRPNFRALPLIPRPYGELAQLLLQDDLLDDYLLTDEDLVFSRHPFGHLRICRALSRLQPDAVIIYGKLMMAYAARLGLVRAARVLYCHPQKRAPRASLSIEVLSPTGNQVQDYLQFADRLGLPLTVPRITLSDELRGRLADASSSQVPWPSYVLVTPWSSDPSRDAPLAFFRECVEIIIQGGGLPVVVTGLASHRRAADELLSGLPQTRILNLVGATSLRQVLEILAGARFLLANDSGNLHMACLVGTKAIGVFGPTVPEQRFHNLSGGLMSGEIVTIRQPLSCSPCAHTPRHLRCPGPYLQCLRGLDASAAKEVLLSACRMAAGQAA